jgi:ankyrin repeat protein
VSVNRGQESVVSLLLQEGADVNAATKEGRTALMVAARVGNQAVAETLLQVMAVLSPLKGFITGHPPIDTILICVIYIYIYIHLYMYMYTSPLLQNNAEINSTDKRGRTALILAAEKGI